MTDPTGYSGTGNGNGHGAIEPIDRMLVSLVVFFTLVVIGLGIWSPNDGQSFTLIAGLISGFSGALLARIKPTKVEQPPGSTTVTTVDQVVSVPPAPVKKEESIIPPAEPKP